MGSTDRTTGVVDAFMAAMAKLFGAIPDGVWAQTADLVRYSTGVGVPRFNGVCVLGPRADRALTSAWLDGLEALGVPLCILSRPTAPAWVLDLARHHGLTHVEHEPLMVHPDPARVSVPSGPDAPTIHRVDPLDADDVRTAQSLFADGFEGPVELLGPLMTAQVLALPTMTAYVGRSPEGPCTVGCGALDDGHVGVFNIATPPVHRRRGFGHAVTARVVAEGVAAGAHTAYLQASEPGYPLYERMGFRTVESWTCYYPAE